MKNYSIKKMPKIEWHSTVLYPGGEKCNHQRPSCSANYTISHNTFVIKIFFLEHADHMIIIIMV